MLLNKYLSFLLDKDIITEEANKPQILATLVPFEASSHEQETEELRSEDNANANKEEGEFEKKSTAVLLSEEELVDLLKQEAEEEQEAEERMLEKEAVGTDKRTEETGDITEDEDAEVGEKMLDDKPEMEEGTEEVTDEEDEVKEESVVDAGMLVKEEVEREKREKEGKSIKKITESGEQGAFFEETDGSTESEIPGDLDYAADSGIFQPLQIASAGKHPLIDDTQPLSKTEVKEHETGEKESPTIADDFEEDIQNAEAVDSSDVSDQDKDRDSDATSKEISVDKKEHESNVDIQGPRGGTEFEIGSRVARKEEEKSKNDSGSQTKGKTRKQKKNQRARKHSPQSEEPLEQSQQDSEGSSTDNTVHKAKRRRAGKWVMKLLVSFPLYFCFTAQNFAVQSHHSQRDVFGFYL